MTSKCTRNSTPPGLLARGETWMAIEMRRREGELEGKRRGGKEMGARKTEIARYIILDRSLNPIKRYPAHADVTVN